LTEGTITRRVIDDTLPGGPVERAIVYHAPFGGCDREHDYRTSWAAFGRRFSLDGDSRNLRRRSVATS